MSQTTPVIAKVPTNRHASGPVRRDVSRGPPAGRPAVVLPCAGPRLSAQAAEALADTFRVLGDPTRIRLIAAMAVAERCVGDLAATVGMSESAVSHQLRMLRAARLVRTRRAGRHIFYTLDDAHILALFEQGLSHVHEPGGWR